MFEMYVKILSEGFCSKVKIVIAQVCETQPYFCWHLAFYRHLPTLGRQNTVKKGPRHFSSKRHLFPYVCTFYCPSQYLFSFSNWRPKSKKFPFFTNLHVLKKIFLAACYGLNLMQPTSFDIASLNRYTPKVFRGSPEVVLE